MNRKGYVFYNMQANNQDEITKQNLQNNNPPEYSEYQPVINYGTGLKKNTTMFYSMQANNQDEILKKNLQNNNPTEYINLNKTVSMVIYEKVNSGLLMRPDSMMVI